MPNSLIISAPGKLFISGEWAVLEPKNPAIVVAVKKRIFAKISDSQDKKIHLSLKNYCLKDIEADFQKNRLRFLKKLKPEEEKVLAFAKKAIEVSLGYLEKWRSFKLELWAGNKEKIGFGFSAASSVAIIAALLKFNKEKLEKERVFKLAALSHFLAQGKLGSGADIVASVYGGCLACHGIDVNWLKKQVKKEKNLRKIVKRPWPNFYVEKLNLPKELKLLVGWTGRPSSTPELIKKIKRWQKRAPKTYKKIISGISRITKKMILSFRKKNKKQILNLIKENEKYLKELGRASGTEIETKKLKSLSEIAERFGGAGKITGAGGGDCGICLVSSQRSADKIKKEWKKNGIIALKIKIDHSGVGLSF